MADADKSGALVAAADARKAIEKVGEKVYDDLLSRSMKAISSVAAPPVEALARLVERILGEKSPRDLQQPPAHIMGPVAVGFVFSQDSEELRSMFARLLASSMEGRSCHPAFANFIQQLSPADARLLRLVSENLHWGLQWGQMSCTQLIEYECEHGNVKRKLGDRVTGILIFGRKTPFTWDEPASFANLQRLGLLEETGTVVGNYNSQISTLCHLLDRTTEEAGWPEGQRRQTSSKIIDMRLTDLGRIFVETVIPGSEWTW